MGQFPDVPEDNVFIDDIEWLAEKGITTGDNEGNFRPKDPVRREHMAAFLRRTVRLVQPDLAERDPLPEPPPTGEWGDGVAFLNRPEHPGQYILEGARNVIIEGFKFTNRPAVDTTNRHVCIWLVNCRDIVIRYNDFQNVGQPIAVAGCTGITVHHNRVDGITGPSTRVGNQQGNFFQTTGATNRDIVVERNKIRARGDTEDIISFWGADGAAALYNWIDGEGWSSASGTGIILGDGGGNNQVAIGNRLRHPGQVGLQCVEGDNFLFEDNIVWSTGPHPGANTGVTTWDGPTNVHYRNNRVLYERADGYSGYWFGGGGVVEVVGNNWEDHSLTEADVAFEL